MPIIKVRKDRGQYNRRPSDEPLGRWLDYIPLQGGKLEDGKVYVVSELRARARSEDPDTSHAAAASQSLEQLNAVQRHVLELLLNAPGPASSMPGLTDEQLCRLYRWRASTFEACPPATDQSIRSRRAELVRAGHVGDTGLTRPTETGRQATVWQAIITSVEV